MIQFKIDLAVQFSLKGSDDGDRNFLDDSSWVGKDSDGIRTYRFYPPGLVIWHSDYSEITENIGVDGFWNYLADLISAYILKYEGKLLSLPPAAQVVLGVSRYYYGDNSGGYNAAFSVPAKVVHICSRFNMDIDFRHLLMEDKEYYLNYLSTLNIVESKDVLPPPEM